jgi:hypothetical protein
MREPRFQRILSIALPTEIFNLIKAATDELKISLGEWFREAAQLKIQSDEFKNREEKHNG